MKTILTEQEQLSLAITVATQAHASTFTMNADESYAVINGQFDKGGKPYILHPLHLMTQLLFDTQLATIAVLHDVIEDSDFTIEDLIKMGFSKRVCIALNLLTHKKHDDYLKDYIVNIASNYDAIRVKRKDLEHNSCITRLKNKDITKRDEVRLKKYHQAFQYLTDAKRKFED